MEGVGVSGYAQKIKCYSDDGSLPSIPGFMATLPPGGLLTFDFGYSLVGPWLQSGGGGDVYASASIRSMISDTATPRVLSLNGVDGSHGTPGIVTYGTTYTLDPNYGDSRPYISSDGTGTGLGHYDWLVNGTYASTDFYDLMYHKFSSPSPTDTGADIHLPGRLAGSTSPGQATVYYYDGNVTIDPVAGGWVIPGNQRVVVFVSGNLTIKTPITITPGGFIAFIVNRNAKLISYYA